jgi:TrmH family RNA methyltransferase
MNYLDRVERITSTHNPILKEVRRAVARGGLTNDGLCVAEGFHLLEEALRSGLEIPAILATDAAISGAAGLVSSSKNAEKTRLLTTSEALFRDFSSTENSQGLIALVRPPAWCEDDLFPAQALVLVLDGIQDPGNAGTLIRSAEAFGATGVLLLKGCVNPWNPKALRASAGSLFRLPVLDLLTQDDAISAFTRRDLPLWTTLVGDGMALVEANLASACGIAVGSEAHGISAELRRFSKGLTIPTRSVESLNAATAGAIVLYEAARQREHA